MRLNQPSVWLTPAPATHTAHPRAAPHMLQIGRTLERMAVMTFHSRPDNANDYFLGPAKEAAGEEQQEQGLGKLAQLSLQSIGSTFNLPTHTHTHTAIMNAINATEKFRNSHTARAESQPGPRVAESKECAENSWSWWWRWSWSCTWTIQASDGTRAENNRQVCNAIIVNSAGKLLNS